MAVSIFTDGTHRLVEDQPVNAYAFAVFRAPVTLSHSVRRIPDYSGSGVFTGRFVENVWEYGALYHAARWAVTNLVPELPDDHELVFYSDFRPMVEYAAGRNTTRRPNMIDLHDHYLEPVWSMLRDFSVRYEYIPRSRNRWADNIARGEMRGYTSRLKPVVA
jgi:ribonuclease HI